MSRTRSKVSRSRPLTPKENQEAPVKAPKLSPWSDWSWFEEQRIYYRARKVEDNWQYEYAAGPAPNALEVIKLPPYLPFTTPVQVTKEAQAPKYKYIPEPQFALESPPVLAPVVNGVVTEVAKVEGQPKSKVEDKVVKKKTEEKTTKKSKNPQHSRPSTQRKEIKDWLKDRSPLTETQVDANQKKWKPTDEQMNLVRTKKHSGKRKEKTKQSLGSEVYVVRP